MKTYEWNGYRFYYDTSLKLWTIYQIDSRGNQISREADYYQTKQELLKYYPALKFTLSKH